MKEKVKKFRGYQHSIKPWKLKKDRNTYQQENKVGPFYNRDQFYFIYHSSLGSGRLRCSEMISLAYWLNALFFHPSSIRAFTSEVGLSSFTGLPISPGAPGSLGGGATPSSWCSGSCLKLKNYIFFNYIRWRGLGKSSGIPSQDDLSVYQRVENHLIIKRCIVRLASEYQPRNIIMTITID